MPIAQDIVKWQSLTAGINEMKGANNFLFRTFFGRGTTELLATDTVELSVIQGARRMAPFVKKNGEGIVIGGYDVAHRTVTVPNIRIKRDVHPSELLERRRSGTSSSGIFPSAGEMNRAIREHVALELQVLEEHIQNTEEWLAAGNLAGVITYDVSGETGKEDTERFTLTLPRDAANKKTLTTTARWGDSAPNIVKDVRDAKRQINKQTGLSTTICVMDAASADAFIADTAVKALLDNRNIDAGTLKLQEQFQDSGALWIGRMFGINFWEYGRDATLYGTTKALVPAGTAFFGSNSAQAMHHTFYGPISDTQTVPGSFRRRRFAKSWVTEDPAVRWYLAASRPLPFMKKPDSIYHLVTAADQV